MNGWGIVWTSTAILLMAASLYGFWKTWGRAVVAPALFFAGSAVLAYHAAERIGDAMVEHDRAIYSDALTRSAMFSYTFSIQSLLCSADLPLNCTGVREGQLVSYTCDPDGCLVVSTNPTLTK